MFKFNIFDVCPFLCFPYHFRHVSWVARLNSKLGGIFLTQRFVRILGSIMLRVLFYSVCPVAPVGPVCSVGQHPPHYHKVCQRSMVGLQHIHTCLSRLSYNSGWSMNKCLLIQPRAPENKDLWSINMWQ